MYVGGNIELKSLDILLFPSLEILFSIYTSIGKGIENRSTTGKWNTNETWIHCHSLVIHIYSLEQTSFTHSLTSQSFKSEREGN